jgi:hypothetical protein
MMNNYLLSTTPHSHGEAYVYDKLHDTFDHNLPSDPTMTELDTEIRR